jgi:hypothetical protein
MLEVDYNTANKISKKLPRIQIGVKYYIKAQEVLGYLQRNTFQGEE